jgi:hypothetical protein
MLLENGQWLGRGSLLGEGESRGRTLECEMLVQRDDDGMTLSGQWQVQGDSPSDFVARVAANDFGTYVVGLRLAPPPSDGPTSGGPTSGGLHLHGTAKLDSPPNVGMLWSDSGTLHASFALFAVSRGYGCRGFLRDGSGGLTGSGRLFTWEMALSLRQQVVKGDNIVSLHRRRR